MEIASCVIFSHHVGLIKNISGFTKMNDVADYNIKSHLSLTFSLVFALANVID